RAERIFKRHCQRRDADGGKQSTLHDVLREFHCPLLLMPGPLLRVAEHDLDREIFPEAIDPEFPTIARLLVAAERQAAIEGRAIEIDAPCPDATGNLERALRVAGLYKARQAEGRVIGDFDRFVLGFVVEDGEDGS